MDRVTYVDEEAGVAVRAVHGAIQVDADERPDHILDATTGLLKALLERNSLDPQDHISVTFTAIPHLRAEFPASAAGQLSITDVPLLCAGEVEVPAAMPQVLRLLAHVETDLPRHDIRHVYLRGAAGLRTDLPQ